MAKPTSFRTVRWVRTINLLAQVVLFVSLFAGLNYLALHCGWRFDLTTNHRHSLSPETRAYLKNLTQPVRVIVTLNADSDNEQVAHAHRDVTGLLREYGFATAGNARGKVTTEFIDVFQRRREAEMLGIDQPNTILVLCGDRRRVVGLDELYRVENQEKKAFRGEQAFTAAILDVSSPTKKKIYFLTGHGEMAVDDVSPARGLSALDAELKARNFAVESLDLSLSRKIPEDAAVLVIVGQQGRFDAAEQELLRQYLSNRAGRILALLAPGYPTGLDDLFFDWGVLVDDVVVFDSGSSAQSETGDLILPALEKDHPITSSLLSYKIPLRFGLSRSVRPDPGRTLDTNLEVKPLVATSEQAWGERNYRERGTPKYDVGVDMPGRIMVVTASERRTARSNLPFTVPGGRLVTFGSADWIANGRLGVIGNLTFFMAAINWTTDRDIDLNVPARPIEKFQLALSQEQLQRLRFSLIFILPGLAAALGIVVYITRRNSLFADLPMRTKVTLVLLLLNVALLAVILYARREWQAEQESARFSKRVLGNEAIGTNSLEITSAGKTQRIRLERPSDNAPWELKDPINWPANDFAVRRIIHELEFLEAETSFAVEGLAANGQSLADYGLKPSKLTLTFTRPSAVPGAPALSTRLEIGDTTKVGNRLYVLSPDGKKVHVVGRSLAESLIVGMEELRTDTLFTIPVFEVRSLGMQNAAPAPRVRLRRDGAQWAFEAPIVTRANKAPTEVVISGLNRLRAVDFLTTAPVAESGLDKPVMRVTVEGNSRRETLLVGRVYPVKIAVKKDDAKKDPAPATAYYAKMEDRTQVFVTTIPDSLFETLRRAQETLREPRILDFDPSLVTTVSLGAPGQREPLVLRCNDTTGWQIVSAAGGPPLAADTTLITHLLQRLALLTVASPVPGESGYLRDAPSDAEIENFGFNLPQREITLTLAPVAAANGGLPAPRRLTVQIGVSSQQGGSLQARVLGQSFIYAVAADTLNGLPVAPLFYRDRTVRTLPEGARITGLKLVANAAPEQPLVNLSLGEGQAWEAVLAAEPEARRAALKTVLEGLTTLRAKQFVSDTFTPTTLVDGQPTPWKYALEATLALGGAADTPQKSVTTLQIAERSGGGAQLAGSAEFGVVFSVEQTLLDALWLLTYGARDPGPPVVPAAPAVPSVPAAPAVPAVTEVPVVPVPVPVVPVAAP